MRLIAVANISNGKDTIGFRLLDVDAKQTKDIPLNSILSVMSSGNLQIDNLRLENGKVYGSNGSIDRLPKIVNGSLIGKSPLIVISQLGDIGYKVSDFKGSILNVKNADIITYAKNNGISNGKVVSKDGTEFISSIEGKYDIENISTPQEKKEAVKQEIDTTKDIKVVAKEIKREENYTGELLSDIQVLLPIIRSATIRRSTRHGRTNTMDNVLLSYRNGEVEITGADRLIRGLTRDKIQKDFVYHTDSHTVVGKLYRLIDTDNSNCRVELEDILRLPQVRNDIDSAIENMKRKKRDAKVNGRKDRETGVCIPTQQMGYPIIIAYEQLDKRKNAYDSVNMLEIEKYIRYLEIMQTSLYSSITFDNKNLAMARKCTDKGVDYAVLKLSSNDGSYTTDITLEDIYNHSDNYDNVTVTDTDITIVGLDGVYRYDIDKIHSEYGRYLVKSNRSLKAAIVDPTYKEAINANGELKELRGSQGTIKIPPNVKSIIDRAIVLSDKNKGIIFGEGIEKCTARCITNKAFRSPLEYMEIASNKKVGLAILKSFDNACSRRDSTMTIKYTRDISPEEYTFIRYIGDSKINIESDNLTNMNDEFILKTVKHIISDKLDNLKSINSCSVKSLGLMQEKFKVLRALWISELRQQASKGLYDIIGNLMIDIEKKIGLS